VPLCPAGQWRAAASAGCSPRGTTDGIQSIAKGSFEPAALHAVIGLQVPNSGLYRRTPFKPLLLFGTQASVICHIVDVEARTPEVSALLIFYSFA